MIGPYSTQPVAQGKGNNLCWAACLLFMQNAHRDGVGPGGYGGKKWTLSEMTKYYTAYQRQNAAGVDKPWIAPDSVTTQSMIDLMRLPEWQLTAFERATTYLSFKAFEEFSRAGWFMLGYRPEGSTCGHYNCVAVDDDGFIMAMEPAVGKVVCKTIKSFENSKWSNVVIGYYP